MRIALGNASRDWRGTETVAVQLTEGLSARGHDVLLFCRAESPLHRRLRDSVECSPVLRSSDISPRTLLNAAASLRRHRTEVVITQKDKDVRQLAPVAALHGCAHVIRQETDRPLKPRLHYRLYYGMLADHHIVNSKATKQTVLRSAAYLADDDITVIPNGVELPAYIAAEPADLGLTCRGLKLGYIGQFEERKGVLDLAAAWTIAAARLPHAHLFIAGRGALEGELRRRLEHVPRVHWLGFRSDVPALLRAFDVVVVPSHFEGFGLTAVEAMAAARPVLASRASSLREIIRDGVNGRLFTCRDPAALADGMVELLSDAAARERMGLAGRALVQQEYTVDRMLDAHEALLARITRRG
jgi:glycosyltransferase involved in cell wall biosynthesis